MKTLEIQGQLVKDCDVDEIAAALRVLAKVQIQQATANTWKVFHLLGNYQINPETRQVMVTVNVPD